MVDCSRIVIRENTDPYESRIGTYAAWDTRFNKVVIFGNEWKQEAKDNIDFIIWVLNHEFLHGIIYGIDPLWATPDKHWPFSLGMDFLCGYDYHSARMNVQIFGRPVLLRHRPKIDVKISDKSY